MTNTDYLGYIPRVYLGFTGMLSLATLGVATTIMLELSNSFAMMCGLLSFIPLLYGIYAVSYENYKTLEVCSYVISLLLGINTVPLVRIAIDIDPDIVLYAFGGTSLIFGVTTMFMHIMDPFKNNVNGMYFVGQTLFTWLWLSLVLLVLNVFVQSEFVYLLELYGSLMLFTVFIAYDTGLMIEKCRAGRPNTDTYFVDSLNLFLDFINIFIRVLQILSQLKGKNSKKKKD